MDKVMNVVKAYDKINADKVLIVFYDTMYFHVVVFFVFSLQLITSQPKRCYGGKPPLTLQTIEGRVELVLKLYDKIDPEKVLNYILLCT